MQLKEAILEARKHKCRLMCKSLSMYEQSAKNLLHWLFVDTDTPVYLLEKYLTADDWELDFTGCTYHLRVVQSCMSQTLSFKTYKARENYIQDFVYKYGSEDDGGDNWIDMKFDGDIIFDSVRE